VRVDALEQAERLQLGDHALAGLEAVQAAESRRHGVVDGVRRA
jgi:hypothetical protein